MNEETPDEKLGEIAKDIEVIQAEADTYTIQSAQDVAVATEFLVKVKGRAKRIEELRNYLETQSSRKTLLLWSCGFCTK